MGTGLKIALAAALGLSAFAVVLSAVLSKRGFMSLLLGAAQGIAAIFAVNIAGLATGITLAVNKYVLGVGALFGTPGVISMLMLELLFGR